MPYELRRSGGFRVIVVCRDCGQPVPLNSPVRQAHCAHCQSDFGIPEELWREVLARFEAPPGTVADTDRLQETVAGLEVKVELRRAEPACERCGHPLVPSDGPSDPEGDLRCASCGDGASAFPAPDWLQAASRTAVHVVCTEPGQAPTPAGAPPATADGVPARPVAMACPSCGGALEITAASARMHPCGYCHTEVYLPDPLWLRLHPAARVREFFVLFEGKTDWMIAAEQEAEAAAREEAARRDARAAREAERQREAELNAKNREAAAQRAAQAKAEAERRTRGALRLSVGAILAAVLAVGLNITMFAASGLEDYLGGRAFSAAQALLVAVNAIALALTVSSLVVGLRLLRIRNSSLDRNDLTKLVMAMATMPLIGFLAAGEAIGEYYSDPVQNPRCGKWDGKPFALALVATGFLCIGLFALLVGAGISSSTKRH